MIDFDAKFFWKWTDFTSYLQFLIFFIGVGSLFTWLLINSTAFIEILGKLFMEKNFLKYKFLVWKKLCVLKKGFASVFTEAMLAAPQFYRNYMNKSTEGMSVIMVLMWTSGDLFKTTYFILRESPVQFWLCGILQVSLDLAVLLQVFFYSKKRIDK